MNDYGGEVVEVDLGAEAGISRKALTAVEAIYLLHLDTCVFKTTCTFMNCCHDEGNNNETHVGDCMIKKELKT